MRIGLVASALLPSLLLVGAGTHPANAAACSFEPQGEGRVTAVTDARGFRLEDGREIRLAGIEPAPFATTSKARTAALSAIIAGHDVTLRGQDDAPDRYGRQVAFVYLAGSETPVQNELLKQGEALVSPMWPKRTAPRRSLRPRPRRGRPKREPGLMLPS